MPRSLIGNDSGNYGIKAGTAYVPLDPEYPDIRLQYMINDANADIILSRKKFENKLKGFIAEKGRIVFLDSDWALINNETNSNLELNLNPSNLAYVIYTSGSTGNPKGVQISHNSVVNLANFQIKFMRLTALNIVLQLSSYSFDASVFEIIAVLLSGAKLIIIDPKRDFIHLMKDLSIDTATLPTSLLKTGSYNFDFLRTLVIAGELSNSDALKSGRLANNFINAYGPTEATVCSCVHSVTSTSNGSTIGSPISNVSIIYWMII